MKKEEDFVMGLSIYMACLREKNGIPRRRVIKMH